MTTEAVAKRLPMVFVDAVPGCETRNFDFLTSQGVAAGAKNRRRAIAQTIDLLQKEELSRAQAQAMEAFLPPSAAEQICKLILKR